LKPQKIGVAENGKTKFAPNVQLDIILVPIMYACQLISIAETGRTMVNVYNVIMDI
jgi:hypothetical protein